jgi:hypothetical protein
VRTDRRLAIAGTLAALLLHAAAHPAAAQAAARTWSNVMYLGGVAGLRGKSLDWNNKLTVSSDRISFAGKSIKFEIETTAVRRLNYKGHQHVNDGAVAAGAVAGVIGMLAASSARSTDHYLEVEYELPDGSNAALMLRLHKDNQQAIIDTLHAATGIAK